ncbi:BSD domain-containing protein 1 [Toxocara canis]|uniref:BSD domain-containing protein 1 n=1 Tax=Toxocara canis TaxID=6265 RepID=A0A0B2UYL0_TOXCA|nr:BSD domain-containing protein 1 [Toxocara canis]
MGDAEKPNEETKAEDVKTEEAKASAKESQQDWLSASASWGSSWLRSAKEKTFTTLELVKKDLSEFGDVFANEATAIANTTVESVKHQAHTLQQMVSPEHESSALPGEEQSSPKTDERDKTPTPDADVEGSAVAKFAFGWAPKLPQMSAISNSGWVKSLMETVKNIAQEDTTSDEDQYTEAIMPRSLSDHDRLTRRRDLSHCVLYTIQTDKRTYLTEPEGDEHLFSLWQDEFRLSEYDQEINALLKNCPPMRALYQELITLV